MPVRIASIGQNEKLEGDQNYTKFHVVMPSFEDAGNWGMSTEYHYYSNNLEELKKQVEDNFIQIQKVFKFCR